jgi:hypothetical protein
MNICRYGIIPLVHIPFGFIIAIVIIVQRFPAESFQLIHVAYAAMICGYMPQEVVGYQL